MQSVFQRERLKNTPIFYNGEVSYIIKTVWVTGFAGLLVVFLANAMKTQTFLVPSNKYWLAAFAICTSFFSRECNLVYNAEIFTNVISLEAFLIVFREFVKLHSSNMLLHVQPLTLRRKFRQ
jgi:hypothetical protein